MQERFTDAAGGAVHWNNLVSVPPSFADGVDNDTNTTYTAGPGLKLLGGEFSLANATSSRPMENTLTTLDQPGDVGLYTSIMTAFDGLGLISYHSTSQGTRIAKCDDVACTTATTWTLEDGDGYSPVTLRPPQPKTAGPGDIVMAYLDSGLNVGTCNVDCINFVGTINIGFGDAPNVSLTIGSDGFPIMSVYDGARHGDRVDALRA